MKRLFAIRNRSGELARTESGTVFYHDNKKAAKLIRNASEGDHFITRGPDHWLGPSKIND